MVTNSNESFRASPSDSIGCHTQVFGVVPSQNKLHVASSCVENGGIFCYKLTVGNASWIAGDTCIWNELPERILTNNTDDCGKVHRVTFLESQACVVLLTFLQRL